MTERGNLVEERGRLEELKKNTEDFKLQIDEASKELYNLSIVLDLLKDKGIKAKIIKYYLPIMNKLINKYLTAMDFFVKFTLDENFNETIKSRHRDEFSYMSFSEGEKMRIDLALLLAWREVARMKNSANTNLLILDEVFDSSLDSGGTEEFIKLLHALGRDCNIFVISHKSDQLVDKFPNSMSFVKKNNFSKMV
jgi:DNA repair exonuclease SbcCD ATPase subunit